MTSCLGRGLGAQLPALPGASSLPVALTSLFVRQIDASGLGVKEPGLAVEAGLHQGAELQPRPGQLSHVILNVDAERVLMGKILQPE